MIVQKEKPCETEKDFPDLNSIKEENPDKVKYLIY